MRLNYRKSLLIFFQLVSLKLKMEHDARDLELTHSYDLYGGHKIDPETKVIVKPYYARKIDTDPKSARLIPKQINTFLPCS